MSDAIVWEMKNAVWPAALAVAWLAGELMFRRASVPRVVTYAVAGFVLGQWQLADQAVGSLDLRLAANVALGLFLFELGCRVNLGWFRHNPILLLTGIVESLGTFAVAAWAMLALGLPTESSLLIAALSVATSPATVLRVAQETKSAGQLTERMMHLTAINTAISILLLKALIGYGHAAAGDLDTAVWSSLAVFGGSILLGIVFGLATPWLLAQVSGSRRSAPALLAIAVVLVVTIADAAAMSPLLSALAFGVTLRRRSTVTTLAERGFGVLADLFALFLFVYSASLLDWQATITGFVLGTVLLLVRLVVKTGVAGAFAHASGTTVRKGMLTGLALTPLSALPILLAEHTQTYGYMIETHSLVAISAMVLLLDLFGPFATRVALGAAGEAHLSKD